MQDFILHHKTLDSKGTFAVKVSHVQHAGFTLQWQLSRKYQFLPVFVDLIRPRIELESTVSVVDAPFLTAYETQSDTLITAIKVCCSFVFTAAKIPPLTEQISVAA